MLLYQFSEQKPVAFIILNKDRINQWINAGFSLIYPTMMRKIYWSRLKNREKRNFFFRIKY